jgi:hypothetical protein
MYIKATKPNVHGRQTPQFSPARMNFRHAQCPNGGRRGPWCTPALTRDGMRVAATNQLSALPSTHAYLRWLQGK